MQAWLQSPVISKTAVAGRIEAAGIDEILISVLSKTFLI
jgi:hypothetical protein